MNKDHFRLLFDQLEQQIKYALFSKEHIDVLYIKEKCSKVTATEDLGFWFYLRAYTLALVDINKLFYATKYNESGSAFSKRKEDREVFRRIILGKNNEYAISDYRNLRNALEHIDQRIDEFNTSHLKISDTRKLLPSFVTNNRATVSIGLENEIIEHKYGNKKYGDEENLNFCENFFYDKNEYVAYNERLSIDQSFREVKKLYDRVKQIKQLLQNNKLDELF